LFNLPNPSLVRRGFDPSVSPLGKGRIKKAKKINPPLYKGRAGGVGEIRELE